MSQSLPVSELARAADEARGLAMDAVHKCSSGHLGLPLGCAELGAVLYGHAMNFNADDSTWINRDRFILSAGHGSMFLYGWLHLSGFPGLDIDQVRSSLCRLPPPHTLSIIVVLADALGALQVSKFRALHSMTPGHPEWRETPGVEATTGPLGQGTSNAVGYAVSQKMAAGKYNTPEHKIFDNKIFCLAGDGCMQAICP
jgi:transketolase